MQDAFASYPELKDLLTSTPWCELDSKLLDGLVGAVEAGLRYNKFIMPPVTVIKKQIKVFIYYICVLMLNISSNVPHVQNYYSMRQSSKKIETYEEM